MKGPPRKRRPAIRTSEPFKHRVYLQLTATQYRELRAWGAADDRPLPNLLRRIIDVALAARETGR